MKRSVLLVLLLFAFVAFGCAQKKVATDMGAEEQKEEAVKEEVPEMEIASEEVGMEEIAKAEEPVTSVEVSMKGIPFEDVYFDFDRYDITGEAKEKLMKVSDWLASSNASVLIEGHCDERGTNEYNLALGDRRAQAVKNFLAASGVPSTKIETISFGEEKPVCNGSSESCWSRNRRAHIIAEGGM